MVRGLIDERQAGSTLDQTLEDFGIARPQPVAEAATASEVRSTLGQARQALRRLERLLDPPKVAANLDAKSAGTRHRTDLTDNGAKGPSENA